jgi:zinc and cadmium transporter
VLVSLAVGALFGDAFIHLLPESFEKSGATIDISILVLAGIFAFFILEKFLRWRHEHTIGSSMSIHPVGYMNLFADGVHNLIDGMIIGAAYLVSFSVGIATTMAVILHEIPQEIGDFGVLLHAGFSKTKALFFNFLCASLAIVGVMVALLASANVENFSTLMLPLTAGGFIYIAGSDLLPELHKELKPSKSAIQFGAMITGVALMLVLVLLG